MKTYLGIVVALIIGFIIADYIALHFAKKHGAKKYGGVFSNVKAGPIQVSHAVVATNPTGQGAQNGLSAGSRVNQPLPKNLADLNKKKVFV